MRSILTSVMCASATFLSVGCVVHEHHRPVAVAVEAEPAPVVVEGPGVEVVTVEPAPAERVYVYEPGYPPGTYLFGGFYYYGGHRYTHDVFRDRIVNINIHQHRYIEVSENRRLGQRIEVQHRENFARNGGRHPEVRHEEHHDEHHEEHRAQR